MSLAVIDPRETIDKLLPKLRSQDVTYFPIRHHSPACAFHLQRWIMSRRPSAVLVEGPSSFTGRIDALTDERCQAPVALYTNFVHKRGRLSKSVDEQEPSTALRFSAFYPFCDYSPELVALRSGRRVGARLRFIDLEYAEVIVSQFSESNSHSQDTVKIESLDDDSHLKHSRFINALAAELGCRDFNELWDHVFERGGQDTDDFVNRLATYCALARLEYSQEDLRKDATTAREACMAAAIIEEVERNQGHVLVVTGGFHTVALPDLVERGVERPQLLLPAGSETGVWLMRYSFDKLDALSGYSAGMPSPQFYQSLWQIYQDDSLANGARVAALERIGADALVCVSRRTREKQLPEPASTADAMAAFQVSRQLAVLRGHDWPMREDILDGVRSCFVKGEMSIEGQHVIRLALEVLAGDRIGSLPPGSDVPPIVADFQRESRRLKLPIDCIEKREYCLDLYRNAKHREISRLFHRLNWLGVPFAKLVSGPDFLTGHRLDLIQENWLVGWSALVDSALIEATIYGVTIEDAAWCKLSEQIASLEKEGTARSSSAAVSLLVRACRLGLHTHIGVLVGLIDGHIAEDAVLPSVTGGLAQLDLLARARQPLGARNLEALPGLIVAAYQRACRLLSDAVHCPDGAIDNVFQALQVLREIVVSYRSDERFDADLFFGGLRSIINAPPEHAQSAVVGAAAGILFGENCITDNDLIELVCGYLRGGINNPAKCVGVLRGLLATACHIAWQVVEVLKAINEQFQSWDDETFMEMLPDLRLAFTSLTPREVSRVAEQVAKLHGQTSFGDLIYTDITEAELQAGLSLNSCVHQSLERDGLLPHDA